MTPTVPMHTADHHIVKQRRNGSTIYRCNHHTHYMKVGDESQIRDEVSLYETIRGYGFPVPALIEYEIHPDSLCWMKEESLQGQLFSDVFTEDCVSQDKGSEISHAHFHAFCEYQVRHIDLQRTTIDTGISGKSFDCVMHRLYDEGILPKDACDFLQGFIADHTNHLPVVRNHGDHNPYNIFTDGVIDLEDSFDGPIGYDTVTSLTQNFWFPVADAELTQEHRFSEKQIREYLSYDWGIPYNIMESRVFAALFAMRGVFVTVGSSWAPQLQHYRYQKLQDLIHFLQDCDFSACSSSDGGSHDAISFFMQNYRVLKGV